MAMNMVGVILSYLDWLKQRRVQQHAPVIGEMQEVGQQGAVNTYGPDTVRAALTAQGVNVPVMPKTASEFMITLFPI